MAKTNSNQNETVQKLLAAIEYAADSIFITDKQGIIEYVNPAFEKLTGYSKDEAIGNTPKLLYSGEHDRKFYKKLWDAVLAGKVYRTLFINKKKNGTLYYEEETIAPVKNKQGKIRYFVSAGRDVTKRKKQEIQTEYFISMASHELKTPLTTIKAYTQLLQKKIDKKNNAQQHYYLSKINNKVDFLTRLINNLLDVSRIKSGKLEYDKKIYDFDWMIKELVEDLQRGIDSHQLILKGKTQKQVNVDKNRIGEVVTNLINNAIKYSPEANKIIINHNDTNGSVIVSVQDFGIGIPKSQQKKIFDLFYQIKDKENTNIVGLGIGLYLASEIINAHKGKLWIESEKNKGSIFYFSLPIKE